MLDVHPPHEAAHTWKDFFIHIATIVVGLLIAVSLEQAVEYLHHRHQVHELREALKQERDENRRIFPLNVALFRWDRAKLRNNLRIMLYLQQHPGTPEEKLPGVPEWRFGYEPIVDAAYKNAQQTQVLSMLPREEAEDLAKFYLLIGFQETSSYRSVADALKVGAYATADDADPSHLSPAAVDKQIDLLHDALNENLEWGIWLMNVTKDNPDFPGGPAMKEIDDDAGFRHNTEDSNKLAAAQARTDEALHTTYAAVIAAQAAMKK
jgi:hypothetical protein